MKNLIKNETKHKNCSHTAPTSPAMPSPSASPPPGLLMLRWIKILFTNLVTLIAFKHHCLYSPRPGPSLRVHGRQLIPDKENPPQEILDWVSQFSRWSHAERLLALDQLIESCEPQQVRHMMQVTIWNNLIMCAKQQLNV